MFCFDMSRDLEWEHFKSEASNMALADKNITCRDCGVTFIFSVGEQEFFAEKGFNEPGRCPQFRSARRNQNTGGFSDRDFGGGGGQREMHPVICAECGTNAEVPFLPRGDKPVYCSDCFGRMRQ